MLKAKELVRTNVMLDKELLKLIDEFAETILEDRSTVIRQLIKKAIIDEKVTIAVRKYKEGVPFRKAADIAGLDYWDFQAELDKREVPVTASLSFARKRLKQSKN
jgi:predicted HTH domain antitoxin